MKVILLKDVPKIGRKYDVKDVSDGYALNHLLPSKHAQFASRQALVHNEKQRERTSGERELAEKDAATAFAAIQDAMIEIQEKANDQGHLFASIGEDEIANAIYEQKKVRITPDMVDIEKPIKEVGERDIALRSGNMKAIIRLNVVPL